MTTVNIITQGRKKRRPFGSQGVGTAAPYIIPALLLYGWFLLYPMLDSIRLSFYQWSGFRTETPTWVGLDNYRRSSRPHC
jgi:raffinose/stachyose/melibiose transport system permease protein